MPEAHFQVPRIGHMKTSRHVSTVATLEFPMCLIAVKNFIELYGGEDAPRLDAWQVLDERGLLVQYKDLPADAKTYFITHEWHGFDHPDPTRIKTETLIRVLQRLEKGQIRLVDTYWQDQLQFKDKKRIKAAKWKRLLGATAYLWVDWCCMPQPGAEKEGIASFFKKDEPRPLEGLEGAEPTEAEKAETEQLQDDGGKERTGGSFLRSKSYHRPTVKDEKDEKEENPKMRILREDGGKAIRSIPAYIELSDMLIVLAPPGVHQDREEDTCVRSWRQRGWCGLEALARQCARHNNAPIMIVNSAEGTPYLISASQAVLYMPIGRAQFSCCQRNHVSFNLTATQKILDDGENDNTIPCDKPVVRSILAPLIDAKIGHLRAEGKLNRARFYLARKQWMLRGLYEEKDGEDEGRETKQDTAGGEGRVEKEDAVQALKRKLWWSEDGSDDKLARKTSRTLLYYALVMDNAAAVEGLLAAAKADGSLNDQLNQRSRSGRSLLHEAMMFASPALVTLLLDSGANPHAQSKGITSSSAFHMACAFGRLDNVEMWLARFKDWDVDLMDKAAGTALSAVLLQYSDIPTIKRLLDEGADVTAAGPNGLTPLIWASQNEGANPEAVALLLQHIQKTLPQDQITAVINAQARPPSRKWKLVYVVMKLLYRCGMRRNEFVKYLANGVGGTALHAAAGRGDVAIVRQLISAGADPSIRTDLGLDAVGFSRMMGPFPAVEKCIISMTDGR